MALSGSIRRLPAMMTAIANSPIGPKPRNRAANSAGSCGAGRVVTVAGSESVVRLLGGGTCLSQPLNNAYVALYSAL